MKNLDKYRGVIPAFYACYDQDGNIDADTVKKLADYFIDAGVKGVYVNGSSGECIYLNPDERKTLLEAVMEENAAHGNPLTVIAHVACNNTRDSQELAAHAQDQNVDAIAAIPPIYFRLSEKAIAKYWNDISKAAPDTDFVIYNIPQLAGVALTPSLYEEMRRNPNVIGVKNSSMPVQDIEIFKTAPENAEDYVVFNGPDEQFIGGRVMGADGGIGGTYGAMPKLFLKLNDLLAKKDLENARKLQNDINEIIGVLCSGKGHMYAIIKGVLNKRDNLDLGGVREPLLNLEEGDEEVIDKAIELITQAEEKYLNL